MADYLRLAKTERPALQPGDFLMTDTAREITRSLELVIMLPGPAMTMISGAPGVGKTATLENFKAEGFVVLMITGADGEDTPMHLSAELCRLFKINCASLSLTARRHALFVYMRGGDLILLVDECQHYSDAAIEWLRAMSEEADFKLVLSGDGSLAQRIGSMKQLSSRVLCPVIIQAVQKRDVAAYAGACGLDGKGITDALFSVALLGGGLRNVRNVLHLAAKFAGDNPTWLADIMAAITQMRLFQKGGKQ